MRVLVISNPQATATTARQRDVLVHALSADAKLEVEETANRGHAAALACRAMRDGVDVVIALGGDGTVNEVVNGLLTDGVHDGVPALGIVPAGSTNVFARALGMPNDPVEATSELIAALQQGRTRTISLGQADERWFVFAAGFGLDAAVVSGVEEHRRRGKKSTHALYLRTTIKSFFAESRHRPAIQLELPGGGLDSGLYLAIVTNCTPWTFLGNHPMSPTPRASFDAGLDVYARTRMGLPSIAFGATRMARGTTKEREFGARTWHDLDGFILRASRPMPFQVDGDALGEREVVHLRGVRKALRVFV
ncbi:diacylglycerol kinase family lipid kinase [Jatrophihabitans telluris]|uniref:Diacylglycerol kinase family lipid kinase n=1 Tax=Jatrophihabitans telluris TaxID=2038343 RepID=A0ABY4R1Y1_9ACTN|nr:diacylglycerol kinase family protein [Jatrophihabitans telluris]UQX89813.1 diacylglycerol kinase family lipid kinase [Jatrophihabitans telluris]